MSNISPVLLREEIGRRLRAAREAAGLGASEAAARLDLSRTSLCRIEIGQQGTNVHVIRSMMDVYDFRDDELLDMAREARKPGWWKAYGISDRHFFALEAGASRTSVFEVQLVPGLLQTADYARAVFDSTTQPRSAEQLANQLNIRLIRQDRLTDETYPLELVTVIDEHALRRPVGGSNVMRAQLRHLALVSELPMVTLQILPTSVITNDSAYGRFEILDFLDHNQPGLAYVNHPLGEDRSSNSEVMEAVRLRFKHLRSLALDPERSVTLIEQVSDELWSG